MAEQKGTAQARPPESELPQYLVLVLAAIVPGASGVAVCAGKRSAERKRVQRPKQTKRGLLVDIHPMCYLLPSRVSNPDPNPTKCLLMHPLLRETFPSIAPYSRCILVEKPTGSWVKEVAAAGQASPAGVGAPLHAVASQVNVVEGVLPPPVSGPDCESEETGPTQVLPA